MVYFIVRRGRSNNTHFSKRRGRSPDTEMSWATVVFVVMVSSLVGGYVVQTVAATGSGRLPDDTEPLSYKLTMEPSLYKDFNSSFTGSVDIAIAVRTSTSSITLNSKDLILHEISVTDENTYRSIGVRSWTYDSDREQVKISLDGHVLASRVYVMRIRFEGVLRDDGTGFFRSAYDTVSDGKKWIVATHFQTTGARSAFPCYDDPHFRTPFNISIKIKGKETALSNMPVYYSVEEGQYGRIVLVHFQETPSMPTCSVAFFAGEFEQFDKTRRQAINVYSHLGRLYQIEYITKGSPELLRTIEDYTGIPYAMPELNLVATPILGSGQVDTWGLTTYQEKTLFVNHQSNSKSIMTAKMAVANAVASQWFGNLVSPAGWEFAWINKGLATFLQYFVTAKVEPEWRLEHFFIAENQRSAMDLDQNLQRQPLAAPAIGPGDVDYNSADRFSKQKAAAVVRMLNDWVGEEVFKKAINAYLTHNQYSSTKPEQLWNAFDNTLFDLTKSGLNGNSVRTVMNTWTERAGYPVVNVKKKDKSLVLTQQRFLSGFTDSNDTTKWFIRLSYTTNKEKNFDTTTAPTVWLDPSVNETIIPIDDDVEWYIFNIQSTGYYRVNYTEENWLSLIKQLNDSHEDVHVLNRAQLIDDSFSLAKVGLLNYTIPMSMAEYLKKEDDIIPWYSAMKSFDYIVNRMKRCRNTYMDVTNFIVKLVFGALEILNDLVAQKNPQRPTIIAWNALSTWMCKLQEYACDYRPTSQYLQRWQNGEEISADIKDVVFCVGLRPFYYNPETLGKLLTLYNTTKSYSERESVIKALPCADIQTLFTYLTLILENKCPIEPSDYEDFFYALSSTSNGVTAMNDFLSKHFTDVVNNVKDGRNIANTMFSILASKVSTDSEIENIMEMAFKSDTPVEFRNKLVPVYQNEVKDYEKWYHNGSPRTIWEHINPSAKGLPLDPLDVHTSTPSPTKDGSSASSKLYNYAVILQILALSISVKFLVHVI